MADQQHLAGAEAVGLIEIFDKVLLAKNACCWTPSPQKSPLPSARQDFCICRQQLLQAAPGSNVLPRMPEAAQILDPLCQISRKRLIKPQGLMP